MEATTTEARIPRSAAPMNEFSDNDCLISGSFWWLFPFGGGWLSRGSQPLRTCLLYTSDAADE